MIEQHKCEICKKCFKNRAIKLCGDKFYHAECLHCKVCHCRLSLKSIYMKDNDLYCEQDVYKLFGAWCSLCNELISEYAVVANEKYYHPECFKCSDCRRSITAGEMVNYISNSIICSECFKKKTRKDVSRSKYDHKSAQRFVKEDRSEPDLHMFKVRDSSPKYKWVHALPVTSNNSMICLPKSSTPYDGVNNSQRIKSHFGITYNKFCNFSYLERVSLNSFRKGPLTSADPKHVVHFHRPDSRFSYTRPKNILAEFKKTRVEVPSNAHFVGSAIRNDWPGPPEPAAAYPEMIRGALEMPGGKINANEDKVNQRISKRMFTLEKMVSSSGIARAIWNDFNRDDPRDAAMDPSGNGSLTFRSGSDQQRLPSFEVSPVRPSSDGSVCSERACDTPDAWYLKGYYLCGST